MEERLHAHNIDHRGGETQILAQHILHVNAEVSARQEEECVQSRDDPRDVEGVVAQHAEQQTVRVVERLIDLRVSPAGRVHFRRKQ